MTGLISLCSFKESPPLKVKEEVVKKRPSWLLSISMFPNFTLPSLDLDSITISVTSQIHEKQAHDSIQGNAKGKPEKNLEC